MNVDPTAIIRSLQQQVADAALQLAIKDAQIAQLEQALAAPGESEGEGE